MTKSLLLPNFIVLDYFNCRLFYAGFCCLLCFYFFKCTTMKKLIVFLTLPVMAYSKPEGWNPTKGNNLFPSEEQ